MENQAPEQVGQEASKEAAVTPVPPVAHVPTNEELLAKITQLEERAKEASMRPIKNAISSYTAQFLNVLEGALSALDDEPKKKADEPPKKSS